jgi:hypothetical protein
MSFGQRVELSSRTTKIVTAKDGNVITVLLMQNVDLGHTKVMQMQQGETLSHQGAITHEVGCSAAQFQI